jgi:PAS domain S-box-containing protein
MSVMRRWPARFAMAASVFVFLIGMLVLVGWTFGVEVLKSILPGSVQMAPGTALAHALCGIALWCVAHQASYAPDPHSKANKLVSWPRLSWICASIIILIGLLKLSEYFIGWNLGIDHLWLYGSTVETSPARIAPATALNIIVFGFALLLAGTTRFGTAFQVVTLLGGLVGWLGLSRYIYGGEPLIPYAQTALHTTVAFVILSAGIICSRTDTGLMWLIMSDSAGGVTIRRLLPPALVVPLVLGWACLRGQQAGLFGLEGGVALYALCNVIVFGALVWANAALLHRYDTERKRGEQALRDSEERHRLLIEGAKDYAILMLDTVGRVVSWNAGAERISGYSASEILGQHFSRFHAPESIDPGLAAAKELSAATAEGRFEAEGWRLRKDGSRFWANVVTTALRNENGQLVGFSKVTRDLTERKRAEQKLKTQLERLNLLHQITRAIGERQDVRSIFQVMIRSLEEHLPIDFCCVCLYDRARNEIVVASVGIHSSSLAMDLAMTEQARINIDENGLSRCVRGQLVYEPDIKQVPFPFPERLARGGLQSFVAAPVLVESQVFGVLIAARNEENGFSSPDCEFIRQLSEHVALASHQAQLYGALQQAYDDLRHTQQAVMQQERLRALGQMASGIAHDINNAVSPATLYTDSLLESEPNLSARAREYLGTIQRALEDVGHTVSRMREFYRQREPQLTLIPVDLNRMLKGVAGLTRARWSDMPQQRGIVIQLEMELMANAPTIMGVESEIREALTNLIFNAVDAMPDGGALKLRTRTVNDLPLNPSQKVCVEVEDTGAGMDTETQRRCLEPFFTTKGERGTGLGLAMVYGVIQRHGAEIEIDSVLNKGTTVRLVFPVPITTNAQTDQSLMPPALGIRLRVLIIDDDPLLLKALQDALESDGHFVVATNSGREGVEAFCRAEASDEAFAIVITDLGMPNMDGRKVASALKSASPSTPIIMLTGWGQRLTAEGDIPPEVDCVLNKPPKLFELRAALARCCGPEKPKTVGDEGRDA